MTGRRILNYQIIKLLGKGGMAKVYMAKHIKLGNTVAIKVLNKDLFQNSNYRARFVNEAKIMIQLQHPNIIKIIDFVENDNMIAIIMEYIEGINLKKYIQDPNNRFENRLDIFLQILKAVDFAHKHGIVHRDLKPDNILITKGNLVKVLDFGIAKAMYSNLELTNPGSQIGTPMFMSPEQVKDSKNIDNLTDIYSLGVIFYLLLEKKLPYDKRNTSKFDILNKIVNEKLPRLKYHKEYQKIIEKATSKNPAKRYFTCQEFANDILKIKNNKHNHKTLVKPPPPPPPPSYQTGQAFASVEVVPPQNPPKKEITKKKNKPATKGKIKTILILLLLFLGAGIGYYFWNLSQELEPKTFVVNKYGFNTGRVIIPSGTKNNRPVFTIFSNNNKSVSAVVIDDHGTIYNDKKIASGCQVKDVYALEDGSGYILGGYKLTTKDVGVAWLARFNKKFNKIWEQLLYEDDQHWSCVYTVKKALSSSSIIVGGDKQYEVYEDRNRDYYYYGYSKSKTKPKTKTKLFVGEYSTKGKWKKEFYANAFLIDNEKSRIFDIVPQNNHKGYMAVGFTYQKNNENKFDKDLLLLKLDKDLYLENQKIFGGDESDKGFKIIKSFDDNYLIAGFSKSFGFNKGAGWLLKIDDDLEQIWSKSYPVDAGLNEFLDIEKSPDYTYMLSGYVIMPSGKKNMRFVNVNKKGNIIFDKIIKSDYSEIAQSLSVKKITTNKIGFLKPVDDYILKDRIFFYATGYRFINKKQRNTLFYKQKK